MIRYRLTPWDTKVFEFKTAEITTFQGEEISNIEKEYALIEKELREQEVKFVYTRIDANDFKLKNFIQKSGFYFSDCSLKILRTKINKFVKEKLPTLSLELIKDEDISEVKEIATNSFNYSRFHEDYNIPDNLCRKRYSNWIDDLLIQNVDFLVAKVGNKIVGFNAQRTENKQVELILAGCNSGSEVYVLSLWNEILEYNKNKGINRISTLISAANKGMANVYSHFDFRINDTLLGFHKFLY